MFTHGPAPPPLASAYGPPTPQGPPFPAQQPYYQSPPPYAPAAQRASFRSYDSTPPPRRPSLSPAPREPSSYKQVAKSFLMDQHVEVQINANVWVMGVVVAVLNAAHKIFGCVYHVEYTSPDTHRPTRSDFWPSSIRECRR
ncbi:unnamed protein product [Peniophora sp. CBMAI 1063]|nr:unnamed protein product [Peniophora sp. CBMAI 1063]